MKLDKGIMVIALAVLAVLTLGIAAIALMASNNSGDSTTQKYKIVCNGVIDIPLLGTDYDIKEASCTKDPCGFFEANLALFGNKGTLKMYVNDEFQTSTDWKGDFAGSGDKDFTIQSQCLPNPGNVELKLTNDKNTVTDTWERAPQ